MRAIILASAFVCAFIPTVSAQQTCSKLAAECVAFNKKGGHDTSRCAGYKAQCMATGSWRDRNRSFDNVAKK